MSSSEMHAAPAPQLLGYLIEFDDPHQLIAACEKVRDAGYTRWDAHTPFPVHGLNDAMGLRPTRLPYVVFAHGVLGCLVGLGLQWWMNAYNYKFLIAGKPIWSIPANIPVVFELTVLFSAFGAFFGMLAFNGLPRFYHSVFNSVSISRVTDDRYFISLEARDPLFEADATRAFADSLGGIAVETLEGEDA